MTTYTSIFNTPPSGTNYLIGDTVTLTGGDVWKYAGNGQWVADATGVVTSTANPSSGVSIKTIWNGSQAEYDAIAVKDGTTLYVIV